DSTFQRLSLVAAKGSIYGCVICKKRFATRAAVIANEKDDGVLIETGFFQVGRHAAYGVVETDQKRKVTPGVGFGDRRGNAVSVLFQDFQRRVNGIVGQIEKPRLLLVTVDEGYGFVRKQICRVALEFLQFAAAIDHVVRVRGAEFGFGVVMQ